MWTTYWSEFHNPENRDRILIAMKIQILQNGHIASQPFATLQPPASHMCNG